MMTKKRKWSYIVLMTFSMLFLAMSYSPQIDELTKQLKLATMEILQLRTQLSDLRLQVADLKLEKKDDNIALYPIIFFTEKGYDSTKNPWAKSPEHLRRVWKWTKQYRHLLTPQAELTAKDFNVELFVFCWFEKETHYNPYEEHPNTNGTIDWGMAQINDVCWNDCYKHLPEELKKKRNPKKDPEIAVAMLYVWINHRVEIHQSWCYLTDEAWTLFWLLGRVNG